MHVLEKGGTAQGVGARSRPHACSPASLPRPQEALPEPELSGRWQVHVRPPAAPVKTFLQAESYEHYFRDYVDVPLELLGGYDFVAVHGMANLGVLRRAVELLRPDVSSRLFGKGGLGWGGEGDTGRSDSAGSKASVAMAAGRASSRRVDRWPAPEPGATACAGRAASSVGPASQSSPVPPRCTGRHPGAGKLAAAAVPRRHDRRAAPLALPHRHQPQRLHHGLGVLHGGDVLTPASRHRSGALRGRARRSGCPKRQPLPRAARAWDGAALARLPATRPCPFCLGSTP